MTELQPLVDQIDAEFKKIADAGGELSMSSYNDSLVRVHDLTRKIFSLGRDTGAKEHASMIRQSLTDLANGIRNEYY